MIFYFSGTGNSKWVAKEIASLIKDNCIDICELNEVPNIDNEEQMGMEKVQKKEEDIILKNIWIKFK